MEKNKIKINIIIEYLIIDILNSTHTYISHSCRIQCYKAHIYYNLFYFFHLACSKWKWIKKSVAVSYLCICWFGLFAIAFSTLSLFCAEVFLFLFLFLLCFFSVHITLRIDLNGKMLEFSSTLNHKRGKFLYCYFSFLKTHSKLL